MLPEGDFSDVVETSDTCAGGSREATLPWSSGEAAGAACGVVEHEADEGFAVVDFVAGDEGEGFGEGKPEDFDALVWFGCGGAFADVSGQVDLHPLTEEAWAREVFGEKGPTFGAIASLFDEFPFGGSQRGFVGFAASGGEFDEGSAGCMTVLAF